MTPFHILLVIFTIATTTTLYSVTCDTVIKDNESLANKSNESTSTTRTARLMKVLNEHMRHRVAPKIRSRSDHFPARVPITYHKHPFAGQPPPPPGHQFQHQPHQALRRVQNNIPPTATQRFRFGAYDGPKNSRYSLAKGGVGAPFGGKVSAYRGEFGPNHPNAINAAATHQHVVPQQKQQQHQQQQQLQHYGDNFKASPSFNGQFLMRPGMQQANDEYEYVRTQQQEQQNIQQHPIPKQPLKYSQTNNMPETKHYPRPEYHEQAPQLAVNSHHTFHSKPVPQHTYSVYEDEPDYTSNQQQQQQHQQQQQQNSNYKQYKMPTSPQQHQQHQQQSKFHADDYLKFMSSDEYFLPKRDPDYKRIDAEKDMQQQRQQYQISSLPQLQHHHYADTSSVAAPAIIFEKPIQVQQFLYREDSTPATSTIVRSSYQAGNNAFVVSSDGNKAGVKHFISNDFNKYAQPPTIPMPTTTIRPTTLQAQTHYSALKSRTPEPVRFEFTERDAIQGAYTNAPASPATQQQQQQHYKSVINRFEATTPRIPATLGSLSAKTSGIGTGTTSLIGSGLSKNYGNLLEGHDSEDEDDMHNSSSDTYGRVPVLTLPGTSSPETPAAQKDNEEYCERICANVQDDDEEVVCGSDGYMYTSEAQMECYASCLHIDVTIQSKGTCNAS